MNIVVLTEKGFNGYIPDNYIENLQWDIFLQKTLKAKHISYYDTDFDNIDFSNYDIALAIPPKVNPNLVNMFKKISKQTTLITMQEGSKDYWLNLDIKKQISYIEAMNYSAGILCPNANDVLFYKGIFKPPVVQFSIYADTLQIEQFGKKNEIKKLPKSMMIGANFDLGGYGLPDVYAGSSIIKNYGIPTMRKDIAKYNDTFIKNVIKSKAILYPYVFQKKWLTFLNKYQLAIQLSNEGSTGQFQFQCACLGIPCIGNKNLTMQSYLFPDLSIDVWEIEKARTLIYRLLNDKTFNRHIVTKAYKNVSQLDTIVEFPNFLKTLEDIHKNHNKIYKKIIRKIF